MLVEKVLTELGYTLPSSIKPVGAYIPAARVGNLLFLSGILPFRDGKILKKGKVGKDLSIEEAQQEAIQVVLNALSVIKEFYGFYKVKQCIKITGYIASAENFIDQPKVLNPASELMIKIFGEKGKHCRVAVGVCSLPLDAPIEMDFIFEIE